MQILISICVCCVKQKAKQTIPQNTHNHWIGSHSLQRVAIHKMNYYDFSSLWCSVFVIRERSISAFPTYGQHIILICMTPSIEYHSRSSSRPFFWRIARYVINIIHYDYVHLFNVHHTFSHQTPFAISSSIFLGKHFKFGEMWWEAERKK